MNGKGVVNILSLADVQDKPRLYSTFLMWLLGQFYYRMPEVGDADKPKLVFFFDEAHQLFADASSALVEHIEQVARLIRSKGIGVFFITQTPKDVDEDVLAQLGNRVQHAIRAFTPKDAKNVKATASTFPTSEHVDVVEVADDPRHRRGAGDGARSERHPDAGRRGADPGAVVVDVGDRRRAVSQRTIAASPIAREILDADQSRERARDPAEEARSQRRRRAGARAGTGRRESRRLRTGGESGARPRRTAAAAPRRRTSHARRRRSWRKRWEAGWRRTWRRQATRTVTQSIVRGIFGMLKGR